MQEGRKNFWIGPRIGWTIFSTLMGCWQNQIIHHKSIISYFMCWIVRFHQQPINIEEMGQTIRGPGQTIRGPIQRRFGPSCIRRVYFIPMSTECHDIRTECQIINTFIHFLLYFLLIINCQQLLDYLLPNHSKSLTKRSPITPRSTESMMSNFLLASGAANLKPP